MNYPPYLGHNPSDGSHIWTEFHIQSWIATQSHRANLCFSAGMEGANKGRRGGVLAKASGQVPGEPDLRYYLPNGLLVLIELKTTRGVLSPVQIKRHEQLRKLGFPAEVVYAASPVEGWGMVRDILTGHGINLEEYYDGK